MALEESREKLDAGDFPGLSVIEHISESGKCLCNPASSSCLQGSCSAAEELELGPRNSLILLWEGQVILDRRHLQRLLP